MNTDVREAECIPGVEKRPWGSFEMLYCGNAFAVKRLVVNPHSRLSMQKHLKRSEVWTVVEGEGTASYQLTPGGRAIKTVDLLPGMTVTNPVNGVHRLENPGEEPLVVIEVQIGICDEDDIIRLHDDYGRI